MNKTTLCTIVRAKRATFIQTKVVKMLLDHLDRNIDLNASSNNGRITFMFACMKGHHNDVKL